jgi:hypothetical protein
MNTDELKNIYTYFKGKDKVTEREKYKYFTENDPAILKRKKVVNSIIIQRGFASFMNDTKWLTLQEAIKTLPFPPPYIEKIVDHEDHDEAFNLSDAPRYVGDWSPFYEEGLPLFFEIEWMKIIPRHAVYRGNLVAPNIIDETEELRQLLIEHSIPHEEENGIFTIIGYR